MADQDIDDLLAPAAGDEQIIIEEKKDDDSMPLCEFVCGAAGTGKTFEMKRRIAEDPKYGLLAASTGIAAMNLGTVTINSILAYFDTDSLEESFLSGRLTATMHRLAKQYRRIIIDEVSMVERRQLELFHEAARQANLFRDVEYQFGLVLVGDFAQLPPVSGEWAFDAKCWKHFDANTTRLQKNWRQSSGDFLTALNHLRGGHGPEGADILKGICQFRRDLDVNFDGTVIMGKNADVDRYNWVRYMKLRGTEQEYPSKRWGKESGGWKRVPEILKLREGTLVTIKANDSPEFTYVNGDSGHVASMSNEYVSIELFRTKQVVHVPMIERRTEQRHAPEGFDDDVIDDAKNCAGTRLSDGSYFDRLRRRWVRGAIYYLPVTLGYAATVHSSQGLTLDRVQVDLRNNFMGTDSMVYVATSRCRQPEGLHLVGNPEILARRCKANAKVIRWL